VVQIVPYQPADRNTLIAFVEAIQEHERIDVPGLKPGAHIGASYTELLLRRVRERDGCMLLAQEEGRAIGFACAWVDEDDDPLLEEGVREHAYISDVYVEEASRRMGIASALLLAIEEQMRDRGCQRIRICSKAANAVAVEFYRTSGYIPYEIIFSKELSG
jgi:ribosomal protein S18 acetylase RimI-like enzyme